MRKTDENPGLFGWCMTNQHEKCFVESGPKTQRIKCPCDCENHGVERNLEDGSSLRMRSIAKKHNL